MIVRKLRRIAEWAFNCSLCAETQWKGAEMIVIKQDSRFSIALCEECYESLKRIL